MHAAYLNTNQWPPVSVTATAAATFAVAAASVASDARTKHIEKDRQRRAILAEHFARLEAALTPESSSDRRPLSMLELDRVESNVSTLDSLSPPGGLRSMSMSVADTSGRSTIMNVGVTSKSAAATVTPPSQSRTQLLERAQQSIQQLQLERAQLLHSIGEITTATNKTRHELGVREQATIEPNPMASLSTPTPCKEAILAQSSLLNASGVCAFVLDELDRIADCNLLACITLGYFDRNMLINQVVTEGPLFTQLFFVPASYAPRPQEDYSDQTFDTQPPAAALSSQSSSSTRLPEAHDDWLCALTPSFSLFAPTHFACLPVVPSDELIPIDSQGNDDSSSDESMSTSQTRQSRSEQQAPQLQQPLPSTHTRSAGTSSYMSDKPDVESSGTMYSRLMPLLRHVPALRVLCRQQCGWGEVLESVWCISRLPSSGSAGRGADQLLCVSTPDSRRLLRLQVHVD